MAKKINCPRCQSLKLKSGETCEVCGFICEDSEFSIKPDRSGWSNQRLWIALLVSIAVISVALFIWNQETVLNRPQDLSHMSSKESENQYGVKFYKFNADSAPTIKISQDFSSLDTKKLNTVLSQIELPLLDELLTYKKAGKLLFFTENYPPGKIVISLVKCRGSKNNTTLCLDDFHISPDAIATMFPFWILFSGIFYILWSGKYRLYIWS